MLLSVGWLYFTFQQNVFVFNIIRYDGAGLMFYKGYCIGPENATIRWLRQINWMQVVDEWQSQLICSNLYFWTMAVCLCSVDFL